MIGLGLHKALESAPGAAMPPGHNEVANEMFRLPQGRLQAAAAAAKPPEGAGVVEQLKRTLDAVKYAQIAGIGRPPTHDELLASPMTAESVNQLDKVAAVSQQQSDARYGKNPDPSVYVKALEKLSKDKEKEVAEERAAIRERVRLGYWPVDQWGEPPEWTTRSEDDAPAPQRFPTFEELAGQGVTAFEDALRAERPPPAAEWFKAKEEGEVQAEALKRARNSALPGVHAPPLSKDDVATLAFEFAQAKAAGREAEFDRNHPIISTMLRETGSMAPMLAGGAAVGPALEGLGVASAGLRGALEMAALDSADQIARMRSGAQGEYDPIRMLTSVGTFAGAAAVSQNVAEWALTRRLKPLVEASGKEAVEKAMVSATHGIDIKILQDVTKEQVAAMSGQQMELIRRIEAARQVANLVGAASNVATYNSVLAAQRMLEDAKKADLGGELGKEGARAVVDLLLSLAASRAFPAHVGREKAAEVADRIADVESETMRAMAAEGPPAAAKRVARETPPPTAPSPTGAFEQARNALVNDMRRAPDEQFRQALADPIVLEKYANAFQLAGEERVRLRRAAEEFVTAPEGPRDRPLQALRGAEIMTPSDQPLERVAPAERPALHVSQGEPITVPGRDRAGVHAALKAAEGIATATGDKILGSHIASAIEVADRLSRNGAATASPSELAAFASAASHLRIAAEPRGDVEPNAKPIGEYIEAAHVIEDAAASALRNRNSRLQQVSRNTSETAKADGPTMRAAAAIELGSVAVVTTAAGELATLSSTGQRQLARDLREGNLKAEARAEIGGELSVHAFKIHLSDGSTVDVAPPHDPDGVAIWRSLHDAYKKIDAQGGAAFFGSSPAEVAFQRTVEHQIAENAHDIFTKEVIEGTLRDILGKMPTEMGRAVRSLLLDAFGYGEEAEAARGLAIAEKEMAPLRGELADAKATLDRFLAPFKNKDELLSVLVELQQRKGKSDSERLWRPEILERGKEALRPLLEVADKIGKTLYNLDRLPWAVHKPPKGRKLIVMKSERAAYEKAPPDPTKWGPLVGGVKFYEREGYLTHALANEVMREAQATDGKRWPSSRLGAITKTLKSLAGSAFKSRKYQGEEAWQRGVRANVPRTLDTLLREIGGAIEARAQEHLANVGLLVKEKPEPGSMADVQLAKMRIQASIKVAQDLLHARMAMATKARAANDRPALARALAEAGVAKQVLVEHFRQLYAADQITSGWKQVSGKEWGPRENWFIRNDALHTLKERSAQIGASWRALFAFTGMQRILRNRYSFLRMPTQNWFSNIEANHEILGASPFGEGAKVFGDAHRKMWDYVFKGVLPENEPVLRELVARGLVQTAAGQAESFMHGSAERALSNADRAAQDGRYGDVVSHYFEAMFHTIAAWPEKLPGRVGGAFKWMARLTQWSDAAPMYAAVRQMVEGKGTPFGRKLTLDEGITRVSRLYDFSRMNPIARKMMRLGFYLVGYSSKVGEALFGPPVKPRFLGMPIPGGEGLAWMARDPTTLAGKAAYAAYKGLGVAGAIATSIVPFLIVGKIAQHVFVPKISDDDLARARDEYLRSEGKGWLARFASRPFLVPWRVAPDGRPEFFDLRPISWIGAAIDFGSGWIGTSRKSMLTSIAEKSTWGGLWHAATDRPTDPPEDVISGVRHSAPYWLTRMVTPGVVFNAIDSALRQWKDHGELNLVPWPAEVLQFLTSIRTVRGDTSEARQRYYELEDEGRYEWTKPELVPKNPADAEAISTQKLQGVNFQTSPAYARWRMLQARRRMEKIDRK